jgi:cytochrome P450
LDCEKLLTSSSDTTAIAITEVFILLAHFPQYVTSIREELDSVFAESKFSCQTAYPVLDSIINETLRLYPPALFASQRTTPSEGLEIGDMYIPGETVVSMPHYQLHRDPRNFERPEEFVPERWTTKSDMILNRGAYMPFSMGMRQNVVSG